LFLDEILVDWETEWRHRRSPINGVKRMATDHDEQKQKNRSFSSSWRDMSDTEKAILLLAFLGDVANLFTAYVAWHNFR